MFLREDGGFVLRGQPELNDTSARALRAVFGEDYDTRDGNPVVDMVKAFGALGVLSQEDEMAAAYIGTTFLGARGARLVALAKIIGGGEKLGASQSTGTVQITLQTALSAPSPLFAVGDIYFIDGFGNEYDLTEDVLPNGTTSVEAKVRSRGTGFDKNVGVNGIVGVRFLDGDSETFWANNVEEPGFANAAAFTGGRAAQSDAEYRAQLEAEDASNRSGSPSGIAQAVREFADLRYVRVYENTDPYDGGTEDTILATSSTSATLSELIDAAGGAGVNTRIAVKMPITTEALRRFIQHFTALFDGQSGTPTFTVRIETDSSGAPSGSLVKSRYELTGWQPTDNVVTAGKFLRGDFPSARGVFPGTTWLVFTMTSGTAKLKGGAGGSAGNVKVFRDGAWTNDANINEAAVTVLGGIPPGGYRVVHIGGDLDTVAQVIEDHRHVGAEPDGSSVGEALRDGVTVEIASELGVQQQLDIDITVKTTNLFQGNANTIKDMLIGYVGGTLTTGEEAPGLNIGEDFIRDAAVSVFFDKSKIVGIKEVPVLEVALDGETTMEQNLTPTFGKQFRLSAANIAVTITT